MASDAVGIRRSNRARPSPQPPAVTADTTRSASSCTSTSATEALSEAVCFNPTRPTPRELERATRMITRMKAADIIKNRGQPPKPNVVACAIALYLNEAFADDTAAKLLFNVGAKTDVRGEWIDGCTIQGVWVDAKFKRLAAHESAVRDAKATLRVGAPVPPHAHPQPLTDPLSVPRQSARRRPRTRLVRSACSSSSARENDKPSCMHNAWPCQRALGSAKATRRPGHSQRGPPPLLRRPRCRAPPRRLPPRPSQPRHPHSQHGMCQAGAAGAPRRSRPSAIVVTLVLLLHGGATCVENAPMVTADVSLSTCFSENRVPVTSRAVRQTRAALATTRRATLYCFGRVSIVRVGSFSFRPFYVFLLLVVNLKPPAPRGHRHASLG